MWCVLIDSRVESVQHRQECPQSPKGPQAVSGPLASACHYIDSECWALAGTGIFQGLPGSGS